MKITLVAAIGDWQRGFDPKPYVPLGLLSIASGMEKSGHQVRLIDQAVAIKQRTVLPNQSYYNQMAELIHATSPDLVGFNAICNSYSQTLELARHYRELDPHAVILFGGPQVSVADVQTLEYFPWVDFILRGEAEHTITSFLDCLTQGSGWDQLNGLTYRYDGSVHRNPESQAIADIEALPMPAYHLYPCDALQEFEWIPIEAGRGCPFKCSFCSTSGYFQRRFRMKSAQRLIAEMQFLAGQYGLRKFTLYHDLFTANRKRVHEFCQAILAAGLDFQWGCSARVDCVGPELLEEMAAAGCQNIFFGVETASQRLQKRIHKNLPVQAIVPTVKSALEQNIQLGMSFILGFPEETEADLFTTLEMGLHIFRLGRGNVALQLHMLSPLAGSLLYEEHKDHLLYDGDFSDVSSFVPILPERELNFIRSFPEAFTSFYYFPTPFVEREKVKAVAASANIYGFPHLLLGLQTLPGGLPQIFDRWLIWRKSHYQDPAQDYYDWYQNNQFGLDFIQFLREEHRAGRLQAPYLTDFLEYHAIRFAMFRNHERQSTILRSFQYNMTELIRRLMDGQPLDDLVPEPTTFLFVQSDKDVNITRVPASLQSLFGVGPDAGGLKITTESRTDEVHTSNKFG